MDLATLYEDWRARHGYGWGLSWYLAAEIVRRYAGRIGLVAVPFEHEGVGWYGVLLFVPDEGGYPRTLGRITAGGDAELWEGSEHHRLPLAEQAMHGDSPQTLLAAAIAHLGLERGPVHPAVQTDAHGVCIEVCARLALRLDTGQITIRADDPPRPQESAPTLILAASGGPTLRLDVDGRLHGAGEALDLLDRWRAGLDMARVTDEVADRLGLARISVRSTDDYGLDDHRHRYAAWCAGRAAGRGLNGGNNAVFRAALEASDLPALLRGPAERWPESAPSFDRAHRLWCGAVVSSLHAQGAESATFGRAAKLVAIYLKTLVVCGGRDRTPLAHVAHPPIDRILLQTLAGDPRFPSDVRSMWRATSWTSLGSDAYDEVIASLRTAGLAEAGFWRTEQWWGDDTAK